MKQYWSIPFLLLILGNFTAASDTYRLEDPIVIGFGVEVNEYWDSDNPHNVTLQLLGGVSGINDGSPYYNCGLSQRIVAVTLEVPDKELVIRREVNWAMGGSNLSIYNYPSNVSWYSYAMAYVIEFNLTVAPGDTEACFVYEFEIDMIDLSQPYPDIITAIESVSFTHLLHLNETNTSTSTTATTTTTTTTSAMSLDSLPLILGTGVGFIVVAAGAIFLKRKE